MMKRLQPAWIALRNAWLKRWARNPVERRLLGRIGDQGAAWLKAWRERRNLRPEERRLIESAGGAQAELVLLTRTRVDVGQWLTNGRLWLAWADRSLFLFAAGKRPFMERLDAGKVESSLYNAVTGELLLAPAPGLRQRAVRLAPLEAYTVLKCVRRQ